MWSWHLMGLPCCAVVPEGLHLGAIIALLDMRGSNVCLAEDTIKC